VLVSVVAVSTILADVSFARAETSAKKLQRKLHKLEKAAGQVLQFTGEAALAGLVICAAAIVSSDDDFGSSRDDGDLRTGHGGNPPSPQPPAHQSSPAGSTATHR
jgi:hypothetical protein